MDDTQLTKGPDLDIDAILKHLSIFFAHWKKTAIFCIAITVISAVILLVMPNHYTAQVTILPSSGKSELSGLFTLASQLGYSSGQNEPAFNIPQVIAKVIRSQLIADMLSEKTYFSSRHNKKLTLAQVFDIKEDNPNRLKYYLYQAFNNAILINIDTKIKTVDLSVQTSDPNISAQLANDIIEALDNYNKTYRINKAKLNREFIEKRLLETQQKLAMSENELKIFRERNMRIADSPLLQLKLQQLLRDQRVQEELYLILIKEYEAAKLQEVRDTPIIDIIEKAQPPVIKSGPRRLKTLLVIMLMSLLLSGAAIWGREYLYSRGWLQKVLGLEGYKVLVGDLGKIRLQMRKYTPRQKQR